MPPREQEDSLEVQRTVRAAGDGDADQVRPPQPEVRNDGSVLVRVRLTITAGVPTHALVAVRNGTKNRPLAFYTWSPRKISAYTATAASTSASRYASGSARRKVDPVPGVLSTSIVLPCASAMT